MTKLKQPRKASSSSSAVLRKETRKKGAIPAKGKAPAKAAKRAAPVAPGKPEKRTAVSSAPARIAPAKAASKTAATKVASKAAVAAEKARAPAKPASKATAAAEKARAPAKPAASVASKAASRPVAKVAAAEKARSPSKSVAAKVVAKPAAKVAAKPAAKVAAKAAAKPAIKAAAKAAKSTAAATPPAEARPAKRAGSQLSLPLSIPEASDVELGAPVEPLPESPRKVALKAALQEALEQALASARVAHHAAVEGATHEEARPENDKDTRGLEQSYLARGHAQRVADLEAGLTALAEMSVLELADGAPIALGAIVKIDEADHLRSFLLAPAGGGMMLPGDITVLTPTSPIGRALLGRGVDDECEIGAGAHARLLTIVAVE